MTTIQAAVTYVLLFDSLYSTTALSVLDDFKKNFISDYSTLRNIQMYEDAIKKEFGAGNPKAVEYEKKAKTFDELFAEQYSLN